MENAYSQTETARRYDRARSLPRETKAMWLEALKIRTPSRDELRDLVCSESFELISQRTLQQLFATSYEEYFQKISRRGLSSLIAISDEAFESGQRRFEHWVNLQERELPVYEPVDLFVFQKNLAEASTKDSRGITRARKNS
jgi:hypothetical protein